MRSRALAPIFSALVAGSLAAYLSVRLAPLPDEFHTLSYLRHDSLREMVVSWHRAADPIPPAAYTVTWIAGRVLGPTLVVIRLPSVVAWAVVAGVLTHILRATGVVPSVIGGLVPTLSSLLYLGAYARPYALPLAAVTIALAAWARSREPEASAWWLAGLAVAAAFAASLSYVIALPVLSIAIVEVFPASATPRRPAALVALAVGFLPIILSASLLPKAVSDQGGGRRPAIAVNAFTYWPSMARPAITALVVTAVAIGVVVARRSPLGLRSAALVPPDVVRLGWVLVVVVPIGAATAMALTTGIYGHRYAASGLLGAGILVGEGIGRIATVHPRATWLAGALAALTFVIGVHLTTARFLSVGSARRIPTALHLDGGAERVIALDEYDFLLLRRYGSTRLRDRLRLGTKAGVVSSRPFEVDPVRAMAHLDRAHPVEVVATADAARELIRSNPRWRLERIADVTYRLPEFPRSILRYRLVPVTR